VGIIISLIILSIWTGHLLYCIIFVKLELFNPFLYLHIIFQSYLFTGLFITSHDAMHGTINSKRIINNAIGKLSSFLFAGLSFSKLKNNHQLHHQNPCSGTDPDYSMKYENILYWFILFIMRYVTVIQIIIIGIIFNLLSLINGESPVWLFFVLPSLLSTFQLFFFGTYIPHRKPHTPDMLPFKARTLRKNHFVAMTTCYFFGYHYEHHKQPQIPWWQLYKTKIK